MTVVHVGREESEHDRAYLGGTAAVYGVSVRGLWGQVQRLQRQLAEYQKSGQGSGMEMQELQQALTSALQEKQALSAAVEQACTDGVEAARVEAKLRYPALRAKKLKISSCVPLVHI